MQSKPKILLTGFGPFSYHAINDSASCVNIIKDSGLEEELNVEIIVEVLDVIYDKAMKRIQELWSYHNPFMVIHIGVHSKKNCIMIEKCAHKKGYSNFDVTKQCILEGMCPLGEEDCIYTKIDVDSIVQKFPAGTFKVCSSEDAGLYLCEFVYYVSLSHDPSKVIFIHIPPYSKTDSLQEKANVVKDIVKFAYLNVIQKCSISDSG